MLSRVKNSLIFRLERLMMRGPVARFGFVLILLLILALAAGLLIAKLDPGFESTGDAVWWAFEHVVVPEYVDDDEGVLKRTIATALIVLGSILFAGAVIAILVEWLDETTARLEQGLTPVALNAHFVLLGWTSRTPVILEEIMISRERVERFLHERGVRHMRVAVLAERVDAALMQQLRLRLGEHWNGKQIILRSGSPLSLDDLERVDFAHTAAIVIPARDTTATSAMDADTHTVKTLMTLGAALEEESPETLPLIVVELQDPRHAKTLRTLYKGPMEIITGDEIIARLMVQAVRHPGLSHVYAQLLTDVGGSQIYVREEPELVGLSAQQLVHAFAEGILLGVVRPTESGFRVLLNPPHDLHLQAGDRIAVLGQSYEYAVPSETIRDTAELPEKPAPKCQVYAQRRVLVLGWNHRVPLMLAEFAAYPEEAFSIDIVSQVAATKRQKRVAAEAHALESLKIRQLEFDFTVPAYLDEIELASYDNVVLLASERLKSGAESDARTILGYLLLRDLLAAGAQAPPVLAELIDTDNMTLFENRRGEIVVTPVIVSHMLSRVTLRRELRTVFDELFGSVGCEIFFRRITDYELDPGVVNFTDLQRVANIHGQIAVGIRRFGQQRTPNGGVELNPDRIKNLNLDENDELILLSTSD